MEEALLLVLIAIVAIGALAALQGSIADTFGDLAGHLSRYDPNSASAGK